jgi:sigma-B regulation protein RsbU (phosphoserine phosphatase)
MAHDAENLIFSLARSNPILGRLSSTTVARLIEAGHAVDVGPGEILIRQGGHSDCAYLVLQGELDICVETTYGEVPLARVPAGALIGEVGVFAELPRTATVRAPDRASVLRLDRADLLQAGELEPALLRSILGRLGAQTASFNHAIGLYTNAVSALERDDFALSILDQLRQPIPELLNFEQSFRRMAEQIVRQRSQQAEMASAAAIQRAMLPTIFPTSLVDGRFTIHAEIKPAREVGGDLYDILPLDADRSVIVIGDVCGKGVPASLFMAVTQTVMRLVVRSGKDLGAEIRAANDLLVANNELSMFATLFCGVLDAQSGLFNYCNCGHNPPLLVSRAGAIKRLSAQGPPLGIQEGISYTPQSIALEPGDLLFLYTDGVTEAEDPQSAQFFGNSRLEEAICEVREPSARKVVENVMMRVAEFANGAPQSDDITCVALLRDNT